MQNSFALPSLRSRDSEVNPVFNVVIAYEDFETGNHARKTYDFLVEHLGDQCAFNNQMWKFDVLAVPKLMEMAAADATQADIIIVAAHGTSELPAAVKDWVKMWMTEKTRAIALVGLFDAGIYFENPACVYLADIARRNQMEFFSQPGVWPGQENNPAHSMISWERNGKTFSLLAGMVQQDRDNARWGTTE